jgi:pyruvate formate lyase activating enzyme
MIAGGRFALVKTTLLDYPGKVAASIFLPGCHLRCPYCQNPDFADPGRVEAGLSFNEDFEGFQQFLERRHKILGGLAVSGGEALLHPLLPELISLAEQYGLPVKLDTAGLLPDTLNGYLKSGKLNYVAMDLKTLPERYDELGWKGLGSASAEILLKRTMSLLRDSGVDYEIRTTVVPPLVDHKILQKLETLVKSAPKWIWQPYNPGITLNPDWGNLDAPDEEDLLEIRQSFGNDVNIVVR